MPKFYNRIGFRATAGGTGALSVSAAVPGADTPATRGVPAGTKIGYVILSDTLAEWETGEGTYQTGPARITRDTPLESSAGFGNLVNFSSAPVVRFTHLAQDMGQAVISATQLDKTSDAAYADIPGLSVNLLAGFTYFGRAVLWLTNGAGAGGGKVQHAASGGLVASSYRANARLYLAATIQAQGQQTSIGSTIAAPGSPVGLDRCDIDFFIVVSTAGTLATQFAQSASSSTTSSVRAGSFVGLARVS